MTFRKILVTCALFPCLSLAEVRYTLTPEPQNETVRVTITIPAPNPSETFHIPAWCPGFYFLLNYQKKISDVRAVDDSGAPLKIDHVMGKGDWTIQDPDQKPMTVTYRVLGDDPGLGFFGTNVIAHTAFVNGPSAFMYIDGRLKEPTKLTVNLPEGWDIATPMEPAEGGGYQAAGYDELVDHPIQMGHFERRKFEVSGIPFEAVFVSRDQQYRPDLDKETARLKAVSAPALALFGGAQFKRYVYFIHLAIGNFNGGLEHRAANVQAVRNSRPLDIDDLAAHEYFHAWNVKQIRPKVLGPFDYSKEQRTGNLWFAEGVTDYYAKLTTYRSGLKDQAWLIQELASQARELQRSQARRQYSVADASRLAWENGGFGVKDLSYYVKGLLIGWIFDAVIRDATDGQRSLDDVMRLMYQRYRLPQPGYEEDGILRAINEVSGEDLTQLYHSMVDTTDELPYELLEKLGVSVDARGQVLLDPQAAQRQIDLRTAWLSRPGGIR